MSKNDIVINKYNINHRSARRLFRVNSYMHFENRFSKALWGNAGEGCGRRAEAERDTPRISTTGMEKAALCVRFPLIFPSFIAS